MIDVILLRLMRRRSDYYKLFDLIEPSTLDPRAMALIEDYGK